jgi:hypothetical protein
VHNLVVGAKVVKVSLYSGRMVRRVIFGLLALNNKNAFGASFFRMYF